MTDRTNRTGRHERREASAYSSICIHKTRYESKARARDILRRRKRDGIRQRIYECPHCGYWHLTHADARKGR